jgi:hypothetical protein
MRMRIARTICLVVSGLLCLAALSVPTPNAASAQTDSSTIAYVRPNDVTGDEIWLVQSDGSNARRIWSVGQPDPNHILEISDLDWRPDARALAFASDHEFACSLFDSDIYAIWPDGGGYRRVTNGPACAGLAGYPQGSVTVTVRNFTTHGPLYVYVQGAPEFQFVLPGDVSTVTFTDVADFGDGFLQQAVVSDGPNRWLAPIALADVKPGQTVHAGQLSVSGAGIRNFGAYVPSWRSDGARLGYILVSAGSMYAVPGNSTAGDHGQPLLNLGTGNIPSSDVMDWGPTPALANQLLYYSYLNGGIYRVTEDSTNTGTKLVETGIEQVIDLQWLPDGAGFLFTKTGDFRANANVHHYDFASGNLTQLTNLTTEYAIDVSASPDGQSIVFERATTLELTAGDLWIMRRDGTDMRLLVNNGLRPSWSQRAPQTPEKVFVSLIRR